MSEQTTQSDVALVAELNDFLQLEHDALQAYDLTIKGLKNAQYRQAVEGFKGDQERHTEELRRLVGAHGGVPVEMAHVPTGPMKLAVQALGSFTRGDAATVLAFKANERLSRDKYRRAANQTDRPFDIADYFRRAAEDESRHYSWALETLDELGVGETTAVGKAEKAFELAHTKMADTVEGAERQLMKAGEGARRGMRRQTESRPLRTALVALGVGFVTAQVLGGRSGR